MKLRSTLLAASILLALTACNKPADAPAGAPAPATETPAQAAPPVDGADASAPATDGTPAPVADAAAGECAFNLEGNDAMQFNVKNIDVPKSCTEFTINLKHTGKMPAAAMGHNVVIAKTSDINGVAGDGAAVQPDHVKAGDTRVIAHSGMVGGGEATSVKFEVSKIADGGFSFFCTFPGHSAMMQGTLTVK